MNLTSVFGKKSSNSSSSAKPQQQRPQSAIIQQKKKNQQEINLSNPSTNKVKPQIQLNDQVFSYYSNAQAQMLRNLELKQSQQLLRPQSAQIIPQKQKQEPSNAIKNNTEIKNPQQQLKTELRPSLSQSIKPKTSIKHAINQPKLPNPPKQSMNLSQKSFQSHTFSKNENNIMSLLDSSINFADDEYIDVKSLIQAYNTKPYNLDKGLSFQVTSIHSYFKFSKYEMGSTIPIMVSVKTLEETEEQGEGQLEWQKGQNLGIKNPVKNQPEKLSQSRPSIDLICVIDTSGSMKGHKLDNLKNTLLVLIDLLGDNDRLCLITFNGVAQRLTNLKRNTYQNRNSLKNTVYSLNAKGNTDITAGMKIALQVLQNRRIKNLVTSVFLLSDGQDPKADQGVKSLVKDLAPNEQFSIHSFGFGNDHDAKMMNSICELKGGSFYYVEKIDQIDEFFVDALGGLFSVVAQEVEIDVNLNLSDPQVNSLFKNVQIGKTFGPMWTVVKQGLSYKIKISQLFSGVSKDFVFELIIPPKVVAKLNDSQRNAEIITASLLATPVCIVSSTKVVKDAKLTLTLFTNDEIVPTDSEINDAVEFNYLRVQASEAISQAIVNADANQHDVSQNILSKMIGSLSIAHPKNKQKIQAIQNDLLECQANSQPQVYSQTNNQRMYAAMSSNSNQRSVPSNNLNLYSNQRQQDMVKAIQLTKSTVQKKK